MTKYNIYKPNDNIPETYLFDIAERMLTRFHIGEELDVDEYYELVITLSKKLELILRTLMDT